MTGYALLLIIGMSFFFLIWLDFSGILLGGETLLRLFYGIL